MALYETVFIARQDLSPSQNDELAKQMTTIVQDNGGQVVNTEFWGLRQLAYRVSKNRKGHYVLFHIDGPAIAKNELERNLRLNEDILRFMTVTIEKLPEGPSALLRKDRNEEA